MSGETNRLLGLAKELAPAKASDAYSRELDMLASTGEQASSALLAIALQAEGLESISYAGWQVPIRTNNAYTKARIESIDDARVRGDLDAGKVVIVTGFQGMDDDGNITTLGRGGSDTSAVAVAAAMKARECLIYTDVDGVYTTDPRIVPKARRLEKVAFEEMLEMASLGSKVLQVRSVEIAMLHKVRTFVRSSFDDPADPRPGTLICEEEEIVEQQVVTGIAFSKDEAQITLRRVADKPGVAAAIFGPLADQNINVDMIIQVVSGQTVSGQTGNGEAMTTDMTFTVQAADYERAMALLTKLKPEIAYQAIEGATDVVKISAIGVGMRSHAGVAARAFRALAEKGVNIRAITTSEIKFSVLIDKDYTELAVRTLHSLYGLDKVA